MLQEPKDGVNATTLGSDHELADRREALVSVCETAVNSVVKGKGNWRKIRRLPETFCPFENCYERRRRRKGTPASPRPSRVKLAGSGTDGGGARVRSSDIPVTLVAPVESVKTTVWT